MKIAWIGGLSRRGETLRREASLLGHELEVHDGRIGGRGASSLRRVIERAEVVVALTDINSHGALRTARSATRELERPLVLVRGVGLTSFRALLAEVERIVPDASRRSAKPEVSR